MYPLLFIFAVSFMTTFLTMLWLIPKLERAGIVGRDVNKPNQPEVPEMGGFGIIGGLCIGVLVAIGMHTLLGWFEDIHLTYLLAALVTILLMSLIGIFDDLFAMHQAVKATLPLLAALPLMAVNVGVKSMGIPFVGEVYLGILYPLILIPLGIAGASNVTNMLAGFNGLEAGMGLVACSTLSIIAFKIGRTDALVILIPMVAALLAFLFYNRYPSKVLIGDIGTLSIGAVIASSVIIGNFEFAGIILIIPYAFDFVIKAVNGFPSKGWWGRYENGKLYPLGKKPVGLCQTVMYLFGGVSERKLVLTLMGLEVLFGVLALLIFM